MISIQAILFDLDGTLVDSNGAHVQAWVGAFREQGHTIGAARIAKEIGKGGEILVRSILGRDAPKRDVEDLPKRERALFRAIVAERRMQLLPGAKRLLAAVRERGLKTALATSSETAQIDALMESVGVDLRNDLDATVTADDVEHAKPHPDPLHAAADKLGVPSENCAMVGDTVHDCQAADLAEMVSIGLETGAWTREELLAVGASSVWRNPADLLEHLDAALENATRAARQRAKAS